MPRMSGSREVVCGVRCALDMGVGGGRKGICKAGVEADGHVEICFVHSFVI